MQLPKRKSDIFKKYDTGPVYLTENGLKNLQIKLARLKQAVPSLAEEAGRTAAYGDRSDNAEYKDAKANLRRTSWSILSIEDQLKRVQVIKPEENISGTIQLGSTVILETNDSKITFQILGPQETNPTKGCISNESPLGAALIGHKKNDEIIIKTPSGEQKYKILEIK